MNTDFKKNNNYIGDTLYKSLQDYIMNKTDVVSKFDCVISTNVVESTYPLIVFKQEKVKGLSSTLNNELRRKNVVFEINVYSVDKDIAGEFYPSEVINSEITNHIVYFLEKMCRIKNVDLTTGLFNFDNKGTQSNRNTIRFNINWLQDYNIVL